MAAALQGSQVAQILYSAGFRGEDLANFVGIARRESGWQPTAHRTDGNPSAMTGDMGLFQINSVNWPTVSQALGLTSKQQLFDPVVSAKAAKVLFDNGGYFPWGMGANGWQAGGDWRKGVDLPAAQRAVDEANAAGMLGSDFGSEGGSTYANVETSGVAFDGGPITLPSDAETVRSGGQHYAIFDLGGVTIAYELLNSQVQYDPSADALRQIMPEEWEQMGVVVAGSGNELGTTGSTFGTYREFWDSIVGTVMGYSNPARNDAGVLRVLAEFAARPDMTEAELQNRLQATDWFQGRTQSELEWNSISDAERSKRTGETSARMGEIYFQFVGERIDPSDPQIKNYLEEVASGRMGFGAFTEIVKGLASSNEESPWSRQERTEQETQRQRPVDIENTSQRIRETAERWGLQWSNETIQQWAKNIVENVSSDEDLVLEMRGQAQVLYPWKNPETETTTAAAPWLETYRRTMEQSATVNTSEVQRALVGGQTPWEFEQELKKSGEWMGTRNGQNSMYETISDMGQRMGFN